MAPAEVEEAFLKANPNLSAGGISVTCDSKRVNEVRVCLTKDLQFRDCPELERRSCKRPKLVNARRARWRICNGALMRYRTA